jgi:CheY-like chemotaxis protein
MSNDSDLRKRLLMVDDEVPNLEAFQRVFRKAYHVAIAPSGRDALLLLAAHEFDVVLSDFGMPNMTGDEFVERAKALTTVAVVMVTGFVDKPEVVALQTAGHVFEVVAKPWQKQEIIDTIERASEHTRWLRDHSAKT